MSQDRNMNDDRNIVKLRGLPWNSTVKDITDFLDGCEILDGEKGVHLAISHRDGRPNGEAYVELATPDDIEKAFEKNKNVLGHRYIESKSCKHLLTIFLPMFIFQFSMLNRKSSSIASGVKTWYNSTLS